MLPPRLIRPPRSCYPRRNSLQIRWASNGPRNKLPVCDGDAAQASTSANGGDGLLRQDARETVHKHTRTALWEAIKNRFFASPPDIAPAEQIRIPHDTQPETDRTHDIETTTHATEKSHPDYPKRAPCLLPKISKTCGTCKEQFPSNRQLFEHRILSDKCLVPAGGSEGYVCRYCAVIVPTRADAKAHYLQRAKCLGAMKLLTAPGPLALSPIWRRNVLKSAEERYARSSALMVKIAKLLQTLTPSLAAPMQKMVDEYLRAVKMDAKQNRDESLLARLMEEKDKIDLEFFVPTEPKKKRTASTKRSTPEDHGASVPLGRGQNRTIVPGPSATPLLKPVIPIKGTSKRQARKPLETAAKSSIKAPKEVAAFAKPPVQSNAAPPPTRPPIRFILGPGTLDSSRPSISDPSPLSTPDPAPPPTSDPAPLAKSDATSDSEASLKEQLAALIDQVNQLAEKINAQSSTPNPADGSAKIDAKTPPSRHTKYRSNYEPPNQNTHMERGLEEKSDGQMLTRQIHTHARLMKSSNHSRIVDSNMEKDTFAKSPEPEVANPSPTKDTTSEMSEQSLLEELFPEASSYVQPHHTSRNPYPKLNLPKSQPAIIKTKVEPMETARERYVKAFQARSDNITALQLVHCSTELTEMDFRRLALKGKHIDTWAAGGELLRVIPGRDPISLERLPFYYLVFRTPEAALAYQKNASRLHKLSQLHQPSSILSALPPPKGFLEDGEDIAKAANACLLRPTNLPLTLHMVMQPYNLALRNILERGGYSPIVPSVTADNKPLHKVMLQIDGYEPLPTDLYSIIRRDAYTRGMTWPLHNGEKGISRLRDVVDLQVKLQQVSTPNPRSANPSSHDHSAASEDGSVSAESTDLNGRLNQEVMNRVYNRWIVTFTDEDAAKRFAGVWHRRVLPRQGRGVNWKDHEVVRMCNAEVLW